MSPRFRGSVNERLYKAGHARKQADDDRHRAARLLQQAVREAAQTGMGPTTIAQEAGISRQTVYDILNER